MPTLISHSLGYFVAFLVLIALVFAVDQLGLMLWVAWLSRCDGKHEGKPEDNGSGNIEGYTATKSRNALEPRHGDRILCAGSSYVTAPKA